jgi:hypothetical protein
VLCGPIRCGCRRGELHVMCRWTCGQRVDPSWMCCLSNPRLFCPVKTVLLVYLCHPPATSSHYGQRSTQHDCQLVGSCRLQWPITLTPGGVNNPILIFRILCKKWHPLLAPAKTIYISLRNSSHSKKINIFETVIASHADD